MIHQKGDTCPKHVSINLLFWPISLENCMKMKKMGPEGRVSPLPHRESVTENINKPFFLDSCIFFVCTRWQHRSTASERDFRLFHQRLVLEEPTLQMKSNLNYKNCLGKNTILLIVIILVLSKNAIVKNFTIWSLPGLGQWNSSQFTLGMLAHFGVVREPFVTK